MQPLQTRWAKAQCRQPPFYSFNLRVENISLVGRSHLERESRPTVSQKRRSDVVRHGNPSVAGNLSDPVMQRRIRWSVVQNAQSARFVHDAIMKLLLRRSNQPDQARHMELLPMPPDLRLEKLLVLRSARADARRTCTSTMVDSGWGSVMVRGWRQRRDWCHQIRE